MPTTRDVTTPTEAISETEMTINADFNKGLELPWSWVHQFAAAPQSAKSFNFIESDGIPADETPNLLTDGSFDFCDEHFTGDMTDPDELTLTGKTEDSDAEKDAMFKGLVDDIIVEIGKAIHEGKCDIKSMKSICSVMAEDRFGAKKEKVKVIAETLEAREENQFENLDELENFLMEKVSLEPLSKKLLECDIQIDESVVKKSVPDDMILGLIEPNLDAMKTSPLDKSYQRPPGGVTSEERRENIRMVDGFITDAIDEIPDDVQENAVPSFDCEMPALPGIGKSCSPKVMDTFLAYILEQARAEKGMVYPRFLKEPNCPVMINSLE